MSPELRAALSLDDEAHPAGSSPLLREHALELLPGSSTRSSPPAMFAYNRFTSEEE